jgi:hypothetical protein
MLQIWDREGQLHAALQSPANWRPYTRSNCTGYLYRLSNQNMCSIITLTGSRLKELVQDDGRLLDEVIQTEEYSLAPSRGIEK